MSLKIGIVGLPNVGKSTLFNALTKASIPSENYPFCTIDPNVGVVQVPDSRLEVLAKFVNPERIVPAIVEFVDIAGLVKGASKGEGLGNQFLANIREADAILHVVRCFDDDNVIHVEGNTDPERDIDVIDTELILADLESVKKALDKATSKAKSNDKAAIAEKNFLERLTNHLNSGLKAITFPFEVNEEDLFHEIMKRLNLLTYKKVLYAANVDDRHLAENQYVKKVISRAEKEHSKVVVVSAKLEMEVANFSEEEKMDFLKELGIKETGLAQLIREAYDILSLQTYFTVGPKEVKAWTVRKNCCAPKAAAVIHTDFEKGFIRAEVISYEDYVKYNGEQGAKEAGRFRLEGKEYLVQDGDIMHFRVNA